MDLSLARGLSQRTSSWRTADISSGQQASPESAEQMFHVLITHVMRQGEKSRRVGARRSGGKPFSPACTDRSELLPEAPPELQLHPPTTTTPAPSLHLADNHWMFIFKTKDKSAAAALRRQIAHRALPLSPHKACQTGWMEEKLQRASKPAASSSRQHGQLQTRCAYKSRDQDSLIGASDAGLDLLACQALIVFLTVGNVMESVRNSY